MMGKHLFVVFCLASVPSSFGATIYWADWTSLLTATTGVQGTISTPQGNIDVTYTGNVFFAQTSSGTDYWRNDPVYTASSVVDNAPPPPDIIAISGGLTNLISFSQPVVDPVMAWVSLNGPGAVFDAPFTILSSGCGYWGCGTFQQVGNTLSSVNGAEGHGVIQFPGTISAIGFSGGAEAWRGFTVGIVGLDDGGPGPGPVPEPSTWILLGSALATLAAYRYRRSS